MKRLLAFCIALLALAFIQPVEAQRPGFRNGVVTIGNDLDSTYTLPAKRSQVVGYVIVSGSGGTTSWGEMSMAGDTLVIGTDSLFVRTLAAEVVSDSLQQDTLNLTGNKVIVDQNFEATDTIIGGYFTSGSFTASRAVVTNAGGHLATSVITSTELGYLDDVTGAVQGQIDALPTFSEVGDVVEDSLVEVRAEVPELVEDSLVEIRAEVPELVEDSLVEIRSEIAANTSPTEVADIVEDSLVEVRAEVPELVEDSLVEIRAEVPELVEDSLVEIRSEIAANTSPTEVADIVEDSLVEIRSEIAGKSPTAGNASLVTTGTVTTGTWSANIGEMILDPSPDSDHTASGKVTTVTVGVNAEGIGAPLRMMADGEYDTCDADAAANMPCQVIALESGTGSKKVAHTGSYVRDDTWNWASLGEPIYVSATVGTLTQTMPASGDQVQFVGYAVTADIMFFAPSPILIERP